MSSAAEAQATGVPRWLDNFRRRVTQGDVGSLPVILGIVLIWAVFSYLNPNFLTPRNLTNLVLQMTATGTVAVGIVLVLLLGEIDLSVGAVSGLGAAVTAVLNVKSGVPGPVAIVVGILTGLLIGLFQGTFYTRFKIPSFVVTLAGLLAWQGALLLVLGSTGTVNLFDPFIDGLTGNFLPSAASWVLAVMVIAGYVGALLYGRARRKAADLDVPRSTEFGTRILVVAVAVLVGTWFLNNDRGVPVALLILLALVVGFDQVTKRTRYGRYVYAVGGNAEAARRAGISVDGIRISVFALAGGLAACGGILAASRLLAVNQSSGASDFLLNVIAAAVIGGTSLFGGRGSVWSAITGALVIMSISNGMDLLALASSTKFIVTGGVLLAAVTIDAVARQGREASGRA